MTCPFFFLSSSGAILERLLLRLQQEPCAWLSSVRPDGRAHSVPVWHVMHRGCFYVSTRGDYVKARNLRFHSGVALSHPDPVDPVIVEGEARLAPEDREAVRPLFLAKYDWDPDSSPGYDAVIRIVPAKLRAWGKHGEGRWTGPQIRKWASSAAGSAGPGSCP